MANAAADLGQTLSLLLLQGCKNILGLREVAVRILLRSGHVISEPLRDLLLISEGRFTRRQPHLRGLRAAQAGSLRLGEHVQRCGLTEEVGRVLRQQHLKSGVHATGHIDVAGKVVDRGLGDREVIALALHLVANATQSLLGLIELALSRVVVLLRGGSLHLQVADLCLHLPDVTAWHRLARRGGDHDHEESGADSAHSLCPGDTAHGRRSIVAQ
ncbi:MAG: hypothetical protein NTX29_02725 [Actinobacteria bacterium]|nr:hypothetical protein [Actinomycetota bacterium]